MKVVIIAVLLMLSAICSATETAFSSCNRIRLKKLADDGNKSAKKAMNICDNFDKALAHPDAADLDQLRKKAAEVQA